MVSNLALEHATRPTGPPARVADKTGGVKITSCALQPKGKRKPLWAGRFHELDFALPAPLPGETLQFLLSVITWLQRGLMRGLASSEKG